MRRILAVCVAIIATTASVWAQGVPFNSANLQNAVVPASQTGGTITTQGFSIATYYVTFGTGAVAVVNFEGTIDSTNYVPINCVPATSTVINATIQTVNNAVSTGAYRCNVTGAVLARARISGGNGAGTVTVVVNATSSGTTSP